MRRIAQTFPVQNKTDVAVLVGGFFLGIAWNAAGFPFWPMYFVPVVLFVVLFVYFMWVRPR